LYNNRYRTSNIKKIPVLTAIPGVLHARVLLLATRLHPHHAVVSISDSVRATHRCGHGGTLGGAQAFGMAVMGLNTVGPVRTVRLLARLCNRTVAIISVNDVRDNTNEFTITNKLHDEVQLSTYRRLLQLLSAISYSHLQ
jgi:hypothetical protein